MKKIVLLLTLLLSAFAFSTQIAHDMAHLSEVAYESLDRINAWNCG